MFAIVTDTVSVGPDFATWAEANTYKGEHQVEGTIVRLPDEPKPYFSNPEPQEMTASWARDFSVAA